MHTHKHKSRNIYSCNVEICMSNVLFRLFFFLFSYIFFLHYSMARVCMVFCCCLRLHLCYSMAVLPLSRLLHSLPPFVCNAFSISSKYYTFYAVHAVCIHSLVFVILSAQTNFVQNRFFFRVFSLCVLLVFSQPFCRSAEM